MSFIQRGLNYMHSAIKACLLLTLAYTMAQASFLGSDEGTAEKSSEVIVTRIFTPTEERAIGQRLAYCYTLRHKQIYDDRYQQRIERVASRLEQSAGAPKLQIAVIKEERLEAVSFPGGKIFITTGLLDEIKEDDELAAVLAHEAAHCLAHHTIRLISQVLNLPSEDRRGFPTREQIVTGAVINFGFPPLLDDSAEAYEREADHIAVNWLKTARYSETALANILRRIAAHLPGGITHPQHRSLDERILALSSFY